MADDDLESKVIYAMHLFKKNSDSGQPPIMTEKKREPRRKSKPQSISQVASGSHIVQSGGDVNLTIKTTTKKSEVKILPSNGTIGANPLLVERIKGLFNELGLRREERFGKSAYPVMYNEFKKEFGIPKNQKYTAYQLWDEARGFEIIEYIESKLDNTILGRIKNAAKRKGHTQPYLIAETRRLHDMLGWSEQDFRVHLDRLFGVFSRSELNKSQLANYVQYLKRLIDE